MKTCLGQEVRGGFLEEVTLDRRPVREFQANGEEPPVRRSCGRTGLGVLEEQGEARGVGAE